MTGPGGEIVSITYLGGSGKEVLCGITDEGPDGVWVVGSTSSNDLHPPASSSAAQTAFSGGTDVVVALIKSGGEIG